MNTYLSSIQKTGLAGLKESWQPDLLAGFLVFLIALPLCLGVSIASGFPAMSGVLTAIIGGLVVSRINGTHVTVAGPAAGLIVVIFTAVQSMGQGDVLAGCRFTLAAIVVSGLLQIAMGVYKAGRLSAYFPSTVMHGLLAAIGIIIIAKQIPVMVGVKPADGTVLSSIALIPHSLAFFIPEAAFAGLASLALLLFWPQVNHPLLKQVPAPVLVIVVGMALGRIFNLAHLQPGQDFIAPKDLSFGPDFLVTIPSSLSASLMFPDFSKVFTLMFWEAVLAITLIGSLETLMVAAAVEKLDPYKRYSDLNRDLRAIGIGNTLAGLVGGLPMIVEILRSSTAINSGAKTGWTSFFHGGFLLLFVALFPFVIDKIPLASLAALLVYTGYRLASPKTFAKHMEVGKAQFLIFVITIAAALATNLLFGVMIGIIAKLLIHLSQGVPPKELLNISYTVEKPSEETWVFKVNSAAVFSNFISLKTEVTELPEGKKIIFDLTDAYLIDHTVMEFMEHFRLEYTAKGGQCEIHGLDRLAPFSQHELAARKRKS